MRFDDAINKVNSMYGQPDTDGAQQAFEQALIGFDRKIIVLDDDPTGVQAVHGIFVYTSWTEDQIRDGFNGPESMFFILTNSRGLSSEDVRILNREIAIRVSKIAREIGRAYVLISRSDSTLRGHYPLETETLRLTIEAETGGKTRFDGEIICPFFIEGGRYTIDNIHYVKIGADLIPAGETEFARDKTFGYTQSDLTKWVEEKTKGSFPAGNVIVITLSDLRGSGGAERVARLLHTASNFAKVIVNAASYEDIKIFCAGLIETMKLGKNFIIRSGAAIPKILGNVSDQALLTREQLVSSSQYGGLIVVGSHVNKTTLQFNELRKLTGLEFIEFDQHLVLDETRFAAEISRVGELCNKQIAAGITTVVFTRRERLDLNSVNKEDELVITRKISDALSSIVTNLNIRPAYIIAKGGITSSDIGTVSLRVRKALVLGQILPGIPVWMTGAESKFPNLPYIIFPGNVGETDALRIIVERLSLVY